MPSSKACWQQWRKIAQDDSCCVKVHEVSASEGFSPVLQPVYLSLCPIPNVSPAENSPFTQNRVEREVTVRVRVPSLAARDKVLNSLNLALRDVRQSPTMWRA